MGTLYLVHRYNTLSLPRDSLLRVLMKIFHMNKQSLCVMTCMSTSSDLSDSLHLLCCLYYMFSLCSPLFAFLSSSLLTPLNLLVYYRHVSSTNLIISPFHLCVTYFSSHSISTSFSLLFSHLSNHFCILSNHMFCDFIALEATRRRIDEDEVAGSMLSGTGRSNIPFLTSLPSVAGSNISNVRLFLNT